ncbi:hypothetical protein [Cesiribacter sp. SM1]|uniref:hypothetical protein n=1 Tax=Cesiribacter sp. SM1 TaxID=2861196 RepID=UPI001CD27C5E|nr:hypothetical protein [Cesiribacter sp. SM1]
MAILPSEVYLTAVHQVAHTGSTNLPNEILEGLNSPTSKEKYIKLKNLVGELEWYRGY